MGCQESSAQETNGKSFLTHQNRHFWMLACGDVMVGTALATLWPGRDKPDDKLSVPKDDKQKDGKNADLRWSHGTIY